MDLVLTTDARAFLRVAGEHLAADALVGTVATRRGTTVEEALERARAADLVALVELGTRRGSNPVADAAHERVLAIARSRDLHAR